jgi:hypothetical protein
VTVGEPRPAFPAEPDILDEHADLDVTKAGAEVGATDEIPELAGLYLAGAGIDELTDAAARSKAAHPSNHVPQPLPGIGGLAAAAARQLTDDQLVDALEALADKARALPAGDRAAILREAAHRIRR